MNTVMLIGRFTRDPELRESNSGKKFVGFTLAINGAGNDYVDFISCYAWNKQAENIAKYMKKGSLMAVEGKLSSSSKNSNTVNFVTVSRATFLEKKADRSSSSVEELEFSNISNNNKNNNNNDFSFDNNNENKDNDTNSSNLFEDDDYEIKWE